MDKIEFIASAVETVGHLNELARRTAKGFFPFSECRPENRDQWEDAIVYMDDPDGRPADMDVDDVIADMLVEGEIGHHDAISGYGEILSQLCGSWVRVAVEHHAGDNDGGPYKLITVDFECDPGPLHIVIDTDGWRIA